MICKNQFFGFLYKKLIVFLFKIFLFKWFLAVNGISEEVSVANNKLFGLSRNLPSVLWIDFIDLFPRLSKLLKSLKRVFLRRLSILNPGCSGATPVSSAILFFTAFLICHLLKNFLSKKNLFCLL